MVNDDGPAPTSRRRHIARLAVFFAFLIAMFYLVAVAHVIDFEAVRAHDCRDGAAGATDLRGGVGRSRRVVRPGRDPGRGQRDAVWSGVGILVTLGSAVGTAIVASRIGHRAGRDSARALLGTTRADRIDALIERGGLWAVAGQRFVPGISDALASYAFGAFGVPLWQMAVGSFVGSAPRAFVYTALGASIRNHSAPLAYAAIAVWCVTAIIGAFGARRGFKNWRGTSAVSRTIRRDS